MPKHKSIGVRLQKAKSLAARRETAHEWAADWQDFHDDTIARIERALRSGRIAEADRLLGDLRVESAKKFSAFPRVIEALTDEDIA